MEIIPITFRFAKDFVQRHHRHNPDVVGCKFAIGLLNDGEIVGVAICGRPVSRCLDDGKTLEINRVCTTGIRNGCSMLYGACCRIAKEMGYKKIITYTLRSESGASVKASNFVCDGSAGGTHWTGQRSLSKGRAQLPHEMKVRWHKDL